MTLYRIEIDPSLCCGYGGCAHLAPHLIQLDRHGNAELRVTETDDEAALEAASLCPTGAIAVFETSTGRQAA